MVCTVALCRHRCPLLLLCCCDLKPNHNWFHFQHFHFSLLHFVFGAQFPVLIILFFFGKMSLRFTTVSHGDHTTVHFGLRAWTDWQEHSTNHWRASKERGWSVTVMHFCSLHSALWTAKLALKFLLHANTHIYYAMENESWNTLLGVV